MILYYLITYVAVLLAATGQILLKLGSATGGINLGILKLNAWVALGLGAMSFSMLLSVRALSVVPLRDMAFIIPTVYVIVPIFSRIFLKEQFGRKTIIGTIILIAGVVLFNIPMGKF